MANTETVRTIPYSPTRFSTWLGVMCLFVLFGLIVLAVIGPSPRGSDYEQARAPKRMERLKALHEEEQKELMTYAWVDKNKGVTRIPISRAMELTAAELARKKPAPAGAIATAPPTASAAPAAAQGAAAVSPAPGATQSAQPAAPAASAAAQSSASPSPVAQQAPPAPVSPTPATTP